ncbi:MAG: 30S ribosomal protein S12 methylthiotransferase RimO [Paludibacteraceae bacterium]|nr:30S ribosomal protein S12 methylthiotransferase RimO [Paludibacteraceae bacterium]
MGRLEAAGFKCTHDSKRATAPIVIINTCGFIGDAKEESINTILQFAQRKSEGKLKHLYVFGCLSERYKDILPAEIPEVDEWFGKFDFDLLADQLIKASQAAVSKESTIQRHITTPKHYAYLKISEGCNRMCSYCAIPLITGHHTSRKMEDILHEAEWMRDKGVKEINVIAQDLSSYGLDLYGRHCLPELVERMAGIEGIEWIRLHYTYPTDFPDELLDVMSRHDNVCKYLDIALQHCTDHMLSLMKRHITQAEQDALIQHIRAKVPGICLRTTLMVGHPGETEDDFDALCEWVKAMRFDRMGAFAYSEEEGTFAAKHYKDDIPEEIKQKRLERLMAIQQEISSELMQKKIGQVIRVIIDRAEGDYFIGRSEQDSPEVDCEILINRQEAYDKGINIRNGHFYEVKIERAEEFDLYGTIWNRK